MPQQGSEKSTRYRMAPNEVEVITIDNCEHIARLIEVNVSRRLLNWQSQMKK